MAVTRKHTRREEWRKRIERWRDSGLSAEQFAADAGINAGTLKYWKYRLARSAEAAPASAAFVEVPSTPDAGPRASQRAFELEIGSKLRLRVPTGFDAVATVPQDGLGGFSASGTG